MQRPSDKGPSLPTRSSEYVSEDTLKQIHDAFECYGGVRGKVQRSFAYMAIMLAADAAPAGALNRIRDAARQHSMSPQDIAKALGLTMFEGAMLEAIGHQLSSRQALPIITQLERFAAENPKQTSLIALQSSYTRCGCMGRPSPPPPCMHVARIVRAGHRRMRMSRRRQLKAQLRLTLERAAPDTGGTQT